MRDWNQSTRAGGYLHKYRTLVGDLINYRSKQMAYAKTVNMSYTQIKLRATYLQSQTDLKNHQLMIAN